MAHNPALYDPQQSAQIMRATNLDSIERARDRIERLCTLESHRLCTLTDDNA